MQVLIIDEASESRASTRQALEHLGHRVEVNDTWKAAVARLHEETFDLVLIDPPAAQGMDALAEIQERWPRMAVVIWTYHGSIRAAVEAIQRGALDYLEKPAAPAELQSLLARLQASRERENQVSEAESQVHVPGPTAIYEARDENMKQVYEILFRAAETPASILLLGESGTGKSVAAKAIHQRSAARDKPFVTVNCPCLARELLESELFGYVKGAFTGALRDTWGKVRAAEEGTLFLDEIGELPLEIQPKLLRLLQEREYERLGEARTRTANVRVIAATNRNLKEKVAQGLFREDLYYRLNVIPVEMLPLRDRPRDLLHFTGHYLEFFLTHIRSGPKAFTEEALQCISSYHWPGNLRELRNVVERAAILSGEVITPADLPFHLTNQQERHLRVRVGAPVTLKELETEHIHRVLGYARSFHHAAQILGVDETTLYRKRKRFAAHGSRPGTGQEETSPQLEAEASLLNR